MVESGAHAATDITGYGLLGHALEMAQASQVTITIDANLLPMMPQAKELAEAGMIPGGARANREFVQGHTALPDNMDENLLHVMFDPQTSGGLFIAVAEEKAEAFEHEAARREIFVQYVGQVEPAGEYRLHVE